MERVACTLCGATSHRTIMRVWDRLHPGAGRFSIVRCRGCGLVFLNPRPAPDEIGRFYPEGYGSHPQALRKRRKESLYKRIPSMLFGDLDIPQRLESDPFFSGRRGRVLDVGTGGGELLCEFHRRGWEATGLEPFCESSAPAKELGLDIRRVSFEEAELPSGHFDVVVMNYVLEHLHDPLKALRKVARILRAGGMAYIGVQNFDSIMRRVFGARWSALEAPRHLTHFTTRTMAKYARQVGLRIAKKRYEAASNCLRESLLRVFVSAKYGGELPGSAINRLLRTPAMKVLASLASGAIALLGQSDLVAYYLVKDEHRE